MASLRLDYTSSGPFLGFRFTDHQNHMLCPVLDEFLLVSNSQGRVGGDCYVDQVPGMVIRLVHLMEHSNPITDSIG